MKLDLITLDNNKKLNLKIFQNLNEIIINYWNTDDLID